MNRIGTRKSPAGMVLAALFVSAWAAGCMVNPLNGKHLPNHRQEVRFSGYYPYANTTVSFEVYNNRTRSWRRLLRTASTGTSPQTDAADHDWYFFDTYVQLPPDGEYWAAPPGEPRRTVRVRARVEGIILAAFDVDDDGIHNTDLASCAASQGWDGIAIYSNCNSGFEARLEAPCGTTGELCCPGANACQGSIEACLDDHCVVADVPVLDYIGRWPKNADRDWVADGLQGVATNGVHWFFSTTHHIWKVYRNGLDTSWAVRHFSGFPAAMPDEVNHYGGMDFHDGVLWVAFESIGEPYKRPKGIAAFDEDLNFIDFVELPQGTNQSWVAINPSDGLLYTSTCADHVTELQAYSIYWGSGQNLSLTRLHTLPLQGLEDGVPHIQGGDFSANGNLYLAGDTDGAGLWVFDAAGTLRGTYEVPADQGFPSYHEIEGLVIWDTDTPSGFDSDHANRGQIHVLRRDQEWGDEQFDFMHFRASSLVGL